MSAQRFYSLDAMRGIAAFAVVIFHIGTVMGLGTIHFAYLAVDFFFMLSGFVLSRTYEARLADGRLSPPQFLKQRFIRLYPLFGLGGLFGAVMVVGQISFHSAHAMSTPMAAMAITLNMLVLPAPSPVDLFPLNGPGWSLFFELVANAAFAIFLVRLSNRRLMMVCAGAGGAFLLGIFIEGNSSLGTDWATAAFGIFRVMFGFSLGMLLARAAITTTRRESVASIVAIAVLALVLIANVHVSSDAAYDAGAIFIVLPAVLWLGIKLELPRILRKTGSVLGDISYPLYAIHYPILQIFTFAFTRKMHAPGVVVALIYIISVTMLSWILVWAFDAPVRAWLAGRRNSALPVFSLLDNSQG